MRALHKSLKFLAIAVLLGATLSSWTLHKAFAAGGQMYLSPASATVKIGDTIVFTLAINPAGATLNSVAADVNFDTTKLQYVSYDASGSAFESSFHQSVSGGTVTTNRANFQGGVTADGSVIETITFKALVSSGTSAVSLANANAADQNGQPLNPGLAGASVGFAAQPVTACPAGQTGTPPNCVTPPAATCAAGQVGTPPNCVTPSTGTVATGTSSGTKTSTSSGTKATTSAGAPAASPTTTTTPSSAIKITANTPTAQYTQASVTVTSSVPTKAYIKYGLDANSLLSSTPVTDLATTHTIQLDPKILVPGQTYYYAVFSTDAAGNSVETNIGTLKTLGFQVRIGVFDKENKPLRNADVTFHSTPQTAKTDGDGFVTLTGVAPGSHHLTYVSGGKTYSQEITVANDVKTDGSKQVAATQSFSVVYDVTQASVTWVRYLTVAVLLLTLAAGGYFFINKQRRLAGQPVLVSSTNVVAPGEVAPKADVISPTQNTEHTYQLQDITGPSAPNPGSTVAPDLDVTGRKRI